MVQGQSGGPAPSGGSSGRRWSPGLSGLLPVVLLGGLIGPITALGAEPEDPPGAAEADGAGADADGAGADRARGDSPEPAGPPAPAGSEPAPEGPPAPDESAPGAAALPTTIIRFERDRGRSGFDSPRPVYVLTEDRIRGGAMPRALPEALARFAAVHGQETSVGQGSPFLRGFTSRRNLLIIDGIRVNNSVFRSGPNQYTATIDPFMLRQIEVVTGAGSLLYGSDALGGVIRVDSRLPGKPGRTLRHDLLEVELEPDDSFVRGEYFGRFASADHSVTTRVGMRGREGSVGFIGGVTYQDFGDVYGGKHIGLQRNTAYSQRSADLKFIWEVTEGTELIAAWQRTEQRNVPRTHSTVFAESWRGTSVGSDFRRDLDQSRQLAYVQAHVTEKGIFDDARISLSWQRQYENQDRVRSNLRHQRQGFTVHTLGAFAQATTKLPADITLRYGMDLYHDIVDTFASQSQPGVGTTQFRRGAFADDATYTLFGLFAMLEVPVGEWVTLNGGLRYELAHADANTVDPAPGDAFPLRKINRTYDGLIGSTAITLHLHDCVNVIASVSQGFRAPNLDDTTAFNSARSNIFDTPAPDLDPERTTTFELGVKARSERWGELQAFAYYTDLDEFIVRVPTGRTVNGAAEFSKDNVSDGQIYGVESQGEIFALLEPRISIYGGAAWTYGLSDQRKPNGTTDEDPISRINPAKAHLGLRWRGFDPSAYLEGEVLWVREQRRLALSDEADTQRIPPGGTPGYTVLSVRGGVEVLPGIRAHLALENILNRDFRVHGSGTNAAGFNAVFGIDGQF